MKNPTRIPAALALVGSVLGLVFAGFSTADYISHLDRQLHAVHCSFVPGIAATADAENPCRTALYSIYSAVFRGNWWGGIPISLFALGVYAFFAALAVSLLVGGARSSRRAYQFQGVVGLFPLLVSVVMAFISAMQLGVFCKTCVGLYVASILLGAGGIWGMIATRKPASEGSEPSMPTGHPGLFAIWTGLLGLCVCVPTLVYVASLPDYQGRLAQCGKLKKPDKKHLVRLHTSHPKREALLVVDPLCPTCKALHQRLEHEGAMENLDLSLMLFPLDSSCNWMLDRSMHPGSCTLSKAVLCSGDRARTVVNWVYENQEELSRVGKTGDEAIRARVRAKFGSELDDCVGDKKTKLRLNSVLQFAVANEFAVSTPQMFLGDARVCDEDTDLGLRYTLTQLAPEVLK